MNTDPALTAVWHKRNKREGAVGDQLTAAGVSFKYEGRKIPYVVPKRDAYYLPDYPVGNIILEYKGRFGGPFSKDQGAADRQKLVLVKEQHPSLDIRIVFERASKKIYKGSKTTYAMWAEHHGFPWADKGIVPAEWIADLKKENMRCRRQTSKSA